MIRVVPPVLGDFVGYYTNNFKPDFSVIYCGVEYPCHFLLMSSFSNRIHRIGTQKSHPKSVTIETNQKRSCFRQFRDFFYGNALEVTPSNVFELHDLASVLEVNRILEVTAPFSMLVNHANQICRGFASANSIPDEKIAFVAKFFALFSSDSRFQHLSAMALESVLKSSELALPSEDFLLDFLLNLAKSRADMLDLFKYVRFESITDASVKKFLSSFLPMPPALVPLMAPIVNHENPGTEPRKYYNIEHDLMGVVYTFFLRGFSKADCPPIE